MARKTTSPTEPSSTDASGVAPTITLTQQAVNVVRQLVNSVGWAKTISDMYVGGKLLAEVLPTPDISWVKGEKEILAMSEKERTAYLKQDKEWGEKPVTLPFTEDERAAITRAFLHNIAELAKAGRLGPNSVLLEVARAFDIKDAADEKA